MEGTEDKRDASRLEDALRHDGTVQETIQRVCSSMPTPSRSDVTAHLGHSKDHPPTHFYDPLHKLKGNDASLVTGHGSFEAFEEDLSRDGNDVSDCTLDLSPSTCLPNCIDKSCCTPLAPFLTPRWEGHMVEAYRDIAGVVKEIYGASQSHPLL